MPKQARIDTLGALHHIMIRGIEGKKIFRGNNDRDDVVTRLGKILPETSTPCYAWALMSNHAHLLSTAKENDGKIEKNRREHQGRNDGAPSRSLGSS